MRKILLLYLLFFSGSSFAVGLSDEEKKAFIESLATPSSEARVFYRWQSEDVKKRLLEAGEMTPELYEYYVGRGPEAGAVHLAGQGLYVAEDMFSSENYGETVVKVVVKQGYPFIDLNDEGIKKQLQEKNIGLEEAYLLKPRVAVRDYGRDQWWGLKKRAGIQFKPVSNQELVASFKQAPLSINGGAKSRLFNLLPPQDRRKLIDNIEHFMDGFDILFVVTSDPSERMEAFFSNGPPKQFNVSWTEVRTVVNATLPYITNVKDGVLFLKIGWQVISKEDKEKIMDKILLTVQTEGELEALNREIKKQFPFNPDYNEVFTEFQAVLQQKAEQVKGNSGTLPDFSKFLSEDELRGVTDEKRDSSSENRSDESQNHLEKPHERRFREAIQESLTSGRDIGGAVYEYVMESIRCSSDLWKSN